MEEKRDFSAIFFADDRLEVPAARAGGSQEKAPDSHAEGQLFPRMAGRVVDSCRGGIVMLVSNYRKPVIGDKADQ